MSTLFKIKNEDTRTMLMVLVFIVNCEHISNFDLIADFGQANACWVHVEKIKIFEGKIEYIMRYVVVF